MTQPSFERLRSPPAADEGRVSPGASWLAAASHLTRETVPPFLAALRATAADIFAQTGLPCPRAEGWQYTDLRGIDPARFSWPPAPTRFDVGALPAPLIAEGFRIVLVNGRFQPQLSALPPGVAAESLMSAVATDAGRAALEATARLGDLGQEPFRALNTAHLRDGLVLTVEKNTHVAPPLEILCHTAGDAASPPALFPRVLIRLGAGSALTLLERWTGSGPAFIADVTDVMLAPGAQLALYRFAEDSAETLRVSTTALRQEKASEFEGFSLAYGGGMTRQDWRMELLDSRISSKLGGIYLLRGRQTHDFTVRADHFEPGGTSAQRFRGVADDQARAVFQGKVHVRRSAQKTDANQSHHALLLSPGAEAYFKPELEIYADDVKCGHGATAGQLDAKALLYLRSRGIPDKDARVLLVESFLNEGLKEMRDARVQDIYAGKIRQWLSA